MGHAKYKRGACWNTRIRLIDSNRCLAHIGVKIVRANIAKVSSEVAESVIDMRPHCGRMHFAGRECHGACEIYRHTISNFSVVCEASVVHVVARLPEGSSDFAIKSAGRTIRNNGETAKIAEKCTATTAKCGNCRGPDAARHIYG